MMDLISLSYPSKIIIYYLTFSFESYIHRDPAGMNSKIKFKEYFSFFYSLNSIIKDYHSQKTRIPRY